MKIRVARKVERQAQMGRIYRVSTLRRAGHRLRGMISKWMIRAAEGHGILVTADYFLRSLRD